MDKYTRQSDHHDHQRNSFGRCMYGGPYVCKGEQVWPINFNSPKVVLLISSIILFCRWVPTKRISLSETQQINANLITPSQVSGDKLTGARLLYGFIVIKMAYTYTFINKSLSNLCCLNKQHTPANLSFICCKSLMPPCDLQSSLTKSIYVSHGITCGIWIMLSLEKSMIHNLTMLIWNACHVINDNLWITSCLRSVRVKVIL